MLAYDRDARQAPPFRAGKDSGPARSASRVRRCCYKKVVANATYPRAGGK